MSDGVQSLPIACESAEEKTSPIQAKQALPGQVSLLSAPAISRRAYDGHVFVSLSGTSSVKSETAITEAAGLSQSSLLSTVEVTVSHSTAPLVTESSFLTGDIPVIPVETTADDAKVLITPTLVPQPNPLLSLREGDFLPKQRKISTENSLQNDAVVFSDAKEKELYLRIANSDKIPITCKSNHALLHKDKLGSGKRGKCIKFEGSWYTPSEFENLSGLEMSKDWKRSLRYGGRSMQHLINKGYLRPHAATCTCAVCCDDQSVTGPVRYFTPKIRRKRSVTASIPTSRFSPMVENYRPSTAPPVHQLSSHFTIPSPRVLFENGRDLQPELSPNLLNLLRSANIPYNSRTKHLIQALSENEKEDQRVWAKLEKKADAILEKFTKLQGAIANTKRECDERRNKLIKEIIAVLEHPNNFVYGSPATSRLQKSLDDRDDEKLDDDAQEDDTEICRACGRPANSECTGCRKATYCSTECQEKDWNAGHRDVCRGLACQESAGGAGILSI